MCLQETRLNDTCNTTIRRYSIYRRDLPSEHPAGGVCIIVNNQIPHSSVQLNSSLQAIAVRVSMHKVLTICSIYIPPSSPIIAADVEDLLRQLPSPALICGDFNGHNLLWGSRVTNPRGRTIENIILHNNLCLYNDTSMTYLDLSAGTYSALDLTLCHPSLFQDFTWMVDGDLHTSDHFPIHVKGNGPPVKGRPQRWKLHKADWTVFKQLCAEQLNISSFAEISDQYSEFITILLEVADISIPKTSQYPKRFNKPWFNKDCKDAVRERKRLLRKFSLRPTSDNLSSYRQAAAAARRTIRQAKRESWRQYVSKLNSQSSIKSAWDRLRKIRGKGTSDGYKHLNVGGTAITSQLGIANALGQSFCRNSSSDNCTGSFRSYKNRAEKHQLDFKTTNTEVYNQVFSLEELRRSLRASKDTAPGPDSIHYQMLKHLPDCSLALILNIFNTIWITGAIPSSWLEATVIPIPKPGKDHTDPSNYRPIALTSCICKTMERMINCRLTYFLETNDILTKYQSGFRRHRSTIDHLVKFETLVREAFVRREHLVAVFFDLEKAYETTWKYGILRDLFNSGLRGRMPIFINHFLTNRKFRVRVGTTFSDHFDLEMGVPQGSILSVTLFSLKINDIVNHVKSGTQCFLYVDDLVVAYASKSISTIERHLQLSLNKIEKWTNENGFKFSSSKTVSMHFCLLTRLHHDPQLRLGSSPIPLVNSTSFLGLIFDKKLNFLKHMQVLKSKCLRALNLLRILSNTNWGADRKVMLRFYRSLIRSKLDYGSVVYGSARKSYLRVLDPVHNQGLRLSLGAFRTTPAESLYVEAHEPSLYLRREKLSLQYACRLRANPENPCYDVTFHPNHRETFARRQNSIPTFGLRVLPLFEQIGLPLGNIARCVLPSIPPWTINRPIINFCLTGLKKGTTPSYVYLNKFLEVSDSYHGYHHIYTDGSRQNDEVAAAAISSLTSLSSRLPDKSSINIFNTIWITGAIPSSWLEATVIPIPKPGKDHTDPLNYRPIALTSCMCKTMERMINCRLTYYLESNNILTRYQSGFRRNRSTIDHLVRFETLVREAFVRREHLAAVFFDLEKAYETTWKYGILRDLFNSGLRGRMPIFINNFLHHRKFRVRVGTTFSDRFGLEMGVPQGSILSVTLFSLKINDIVNHVKSGTQCFLYVDDLVVAYASKSISTIERHLQLSLNKIEKWTNENGFKFSSSKTVSMHFCLLTRPHHDPQLRLGSSPIPLVNSTRFLGLVFDKKLNFLNHLKDLKLKCFKALNLLRILSNTNWGADRKVMLRFYRSLIRSKLDYGSVVYGSARKSYLRVLDPIHNQGLRLSLGAFRTTPAESLYVEAHEPSLYLRREKLSLQYACRLRANPENPCYDVTFHPNHRETFARRQNSIPTFGLRVLPLFEQIGLPLGNIARCVLPSIPPWTMYRPIINFSLTGLKKGTTPSIVYLNKFLEVSDSYHGYHHIYTDGSRQNDEVAAAAISSLMSLSSRLPDKSSIFSAESKALLLALDIVENSTYGRYIILSDSLSCLMALDSMKYSHPTICDILVKLHLLTKSNHVIFCWLPSHVGISGNEKADFAAKSALSLPVDHQIIYFHDFYMYILKHILSIWQSKWDGEINNKLHAIKPKLGEWALACRKSRKEESILCRLRVGHTYLTHSFLLRNEAQPVCGRCQQPLTVRHVLVDCPILGADGTIKPFHSIPFHGRHLPDFWAMLNNLSEDQSRYFSLHFAQSQTGLPYSCQPMDLWIEVTMNLGSKLKAGWLQLLQDDKQLFSTIRNANAVGRIRQALETQLNSKRKQSKHTDCQPARLRKDEKAVQDILTSLDAFECDLFGEDDPALRSIQSGIKTTESVALDLSVALPDGKAQADILLDQRVFSKDFKLSDRVPKNKRLTFDNNKVAKSGNKAISQAQMESAGLAAVIELAEGTGALTLEEIMENRVTEECLSIFNVDGSLRHTAKSKLFEHLNLQPTADKPAIYSSLIDMSMLFRLATPADREKKKQDGSDYKWQDYIDKICFMVHSRHPDAEQTYAINDPYPKPNEYSIKDDERDRRAEESCAAARAVKWRSQPKKNTMYLPPDDDSMHHHLVRVNYVTYCQKHYELRTYPCPFGNGWALINGKCRPVRHSRPVLHSQENTDLDDSDSTGDTDSDTEEDTEYDESSESDLSEED
ncbi:RNA-directed DNA polymerase from mobile element jockey [Nymphon striatum]|nr:RNA-directed DNA polymerase from mobile element jockey [Nymphon striatum]